MGIARAIVTSKYCLAMKDYCLHANFYVLVSHHFLRFRSIRKTSVTTIAPEVWFATNARGTSLYLAARTIPMLPMVGIT